MSLFSSKAKDELDKLIEENDDLKNTLHSFVQKHNSLTDLENKIIEAQNQLIQKSQTVEKEKKKISSLEEEIQTKTNKIDELDKQLAEIDELHKQYNYLNDKYTRLENAYKDLQNDYNEKENKLLSLREEQENLNASITLSCSNLEDSLDKIKQTEKQYTENISRLKTDENKKLEELKSLDEKISLSEEIKTNLEMSVAALVSQLSEKEKLFTEFINKRDSIIEELRGRQKEFDDYDNRFNYQREAIQKLEDETKELSAKRNNISEEIKKLETVKSEFQETLLSLRSQEERLNESIGLKKSAIDELENRKHEIEESRLNLEKNFSQVLLTFTDETASLKNQLNTLRQEMLDKDKDIAAKEKILLEKSAQVAEYGGLTKVLQKERTSAEQLISNLKEEQAELNEQLSALGNKVNTQRNFMQQLISETELLNKRKIDLERELNEILVQSGKNYSEMEENRQALSSDIASAQAELEEIKSQTSSLKSELRELKLEITKVETEKEEYSAKVSELITLEKNLKHRITEYQKKIDELEGNDLT